MKLTHNQPEVRHELENMMNPTAAEIDGCCDECLKDQLGELEHPWGQGHHLCNPLDTQVLGEIRAGKKINEFINGRWLIVTV